MYGSRTLSALAALGAHSPEVCHRIVLPDQLVIVRAFRSSKVTEKVTGVGAFGDVLVILQHMVTNVIAEGSLLMVLLE
jgi:hypothetical protein